MLQLYNFHIRPILHFLKISYNSKISSHIQPFETWFHHLSWVKYNHSLTWIKAIWGWFPLSNMIPSKGEQWGPYNSPRYIHHIYTTYTPHIHHIFIQFLPFPDSPAGLRWASCAGPRTWPPCAGAEHPGGDGFRRGDRQRGKATDAGVDQRFLVYMHINIHIIVSMYMYVL